MRRLRIGLLPLALAACGDLIEEPRRLPLDVQLNASVTSTTVGQSVDFGIQAQGSGMQSLTLDFGDGLRESINLGNAVLVQISRSHTYTEAGSFVVTATAEQRNGASAQDTIRIEVSEASEVP